MSDISVLVPTGARSSYLFRTVLGSALIAVDCGPEDVDPALFSPYTTFEGKGKTAILRLMENHERYRAFFEAVRSISVAHSMGDVFEGLVDRDTLNDEQERAWELVGEMIEEADRDEAERHDRKHPC